MSSTAETEERKPFVYTPKEDEYLKTLAKQIVDGHVFTTWHLNRIEEVSRVFMLFVFLKPEHLKELIDADINFFFEELSKAGPMAVNGMPTFFSCQMLNRADEDRLRVFVKQYEDLIKEWKG